jgi:hypothetical protein
MRTRKLILLFVFFGFMPLISIGAQTAAPAAASTTQPNPPAAKSSGPTDLYQILRDERKTLERQADRHVQSMKDPYDRALYLIASLLGVGLILFGYLSCSAAYPGRPKRRCVLKYEGKCKMRSMPQSNRKHRVEAPPPDAERRGR